MTDVAPLLERANLLLAQGRPKDAEKMLGEVLQVEPENDSALSLLARCKYAQNQFKEGIAIIQRAIQLEPGDSYYFYLLAFGYYYSNNNKSALQYLQRAIEMDSWMPGYFGLYAMILIDEKDFKQALEKANAGLMIDAENITCLNARSMALNKLKRVEDAIETMRDALDKDPENAYTHTTIGWNLLEKGRHKEAANHFREALRLHPNMEGAQEGLKQALKSKILPYKWLLQYSFWINNKGKRARWIIPLVIYFSVQMIGNLSKSSNNALAAIGFVVIGLYILFAITSWIINPIANFFLLFHKDGKYALNSGEKFNAIATVVVLLSGIALIAAGIAKNEDRLFITGLVMMSLALPMGQMKYPLSIKGNSKLQWASMLLVLFALVIIGIVASGGKLSATLITIYAIGFVIYTWVSAFLNRE